MVIYVAINDKEKLKNDKYSQRYQLIDSDFMQGPLKFMQDCLIMVVEILSVTLVLLELSKRCQPRLLIVIMKTS